jgi:hypothetical protein
MSLHIDCRAATRLVLEGEDRRLRLSERLRLRLHLLICSACPRFVAQVHLMREAMARWRRQRTGSEPG